MNESDLKNKIVDFFETKIKESSVYSIKEKLIKSEIELKKLIRENLKGKSESQKISRLQEKNNFLILELQLAREKAITDEIPMWFDIKAEEGLSFGDNKFFSAATHLMKYSHGLSVAEGIRIGKVDNNHALSSIFVHTESLRSIDLDICYGNGIYITHALFLLISHENQCLFDRILSGDFIFFRDFSLNKERLFKWENGFSKFVGEKLVRNADMAKQVYFPISNNSYNIICPIFSSSLAHAIFLRINKSKYSEDQQSARKSKKSGKFNAFELTAYPDIAVQSFGGAHPRNISALNHIRNGKAYLLPSRPPQWEKQDMPPKAGKNAFWREYEKRSWKAAKELKTYLTRMHDKSNAKATRDIRDECVERLIDILFLYAAEVRSLTEHSGWSAQSTLPLAEQLWLDPLRADEEFQRLQETKDWRKDIVERFASCLDHKLEGEKLLMKDAEYREWLGRVMERFTRDLQEFTS